MENNNIQDYLRGCILHWVDRDLLRMQFSPFEIDNAIFLGQLCPATPGTVLCGGHPDEDVLTTENTQVYTIVKSRLHIVRL